MSASIKTNMSLMNMKRFIETFRNNC